MFDADGSRGSEVSALEPSGQRPPRRQYTLKGVESETIRLMRDAANKEGMKIGSWVSLRMKEAAEKALAQKSPQTVSATRTLVPPTTQGPMDNGFSEVLEWIVSTLKEHRDNSDQRLLRLERELHEITSSQRTILATLLANR